MGLVDFIIGSEKTHFKRNLRRMTKELINAINSSRVLMTTNELINAFNSLKVLMSSVLTKVHVERCHRSMISWAWLFLTPVLSIELVFDLFTTKNTSFLFIRLLLCLTHQTKRISYGITPMHARKRIPRKCKANVSRDNSNIDAAKNANQNDN